MKLNVKKLQKAGTIPLKQDYQFYKGQYDPELRRKMQVRAEANKPVNTTSEIIFDDKTMTAKRNPNAKMGLEIVSPEFQILTAGVGSLGNKAISTVGKIGQTMLHGAGQGAMANMSNLSGSEQSASGLAQDVLGGAVVGGLLKGIGVGGKKIVNKIPVNKPINGVDYLKNYYSHENFLKKYNEINPEYDGRDLQHEIKNRLHDYIPKTYKDLYKDKVIKKDISSNLDFLGKKMMTGGVSYGTPDGVYLNSSINKLSLNPIKTNESTRVHELTHLLENNGNYLTDADEKLLQSAFIPKKAFNVLDKIKNNIFNRDYIIDPTEIHARINQARYELNLKPGDVFTEKMYNKLKFNPFNYSTEGSFNGMGMFIKDKNKFINTMNKMWGVVPAVTTGYNLTESKKQGGKLIPKGQQGLMLNKFNTLSPLDPNKQFNNSKFNFLNLPKQKPLLNFMNMENIGYNSDVVLKLIDDFEGFKDKVYKDGKGIDTIGHGLTDKKYISKGTITKEESLSGVKSHIDKEVIPHLKNKPYWNKLNDNQKSALISYVFNIGSGNFNTKSPSLQKALNEGNWEEAAKQIDFGYNDKKNPGLRKRRDKERQLFLN